MLKTQAHQDSWSPFPQEYPTHTPGLREELCLAWSRSLPFPMQWPVVPSRGASSEVPQLHGEGRVHGPRRPFLGRG